MQHKFDQRYATLQIKHCSCLPILTLVTLQTSTEHLMMYLELYMI